MTGRLRAFVPLGVIAALALSGCSGTNEEASPTLTPVTSSTATSAAPATTTAPPTQVVRAGPPPKTPFTKQGAELFIRDYYATSTRALLTARTADLVQYIRTQCTCRSEVATLRAFAEKHEHFVGHGFVVKSVRTVTLAGNAAVVAAIYSLRAMPLVDSSGRHVDRLTDVKRQKDQMLLRYINGRWAIERIFYGRPS
jgi:hypothetical protein